MCRTDLHVTEGDLAVHRAGCHPRPRGGRGGGRGRRRTPVTASPWGIGWASPGCGIPAGCATTARRGDENLCPNSRYTGWDADGGYADFATVPAAFAHHLPDGYTDSELAPLLCAGIIGYRSLLRAQLPAGGRLGLYGFGGSAHITAQVALAQGAEVHVMTRGDEARRLALDLGAASAQGAGRPAAGEAGRRDPVRPGR